MNLEDRVVAYEIDEYVDPEYGDETINLNCVLSWRVKKTSGIDRASELDINFHNGWIFHSTEAGRWWQRNGQLQERTIEHLRRL